MENNENNVNESITNNEVLNSNDTNESIINKGKNLNEKNFKSKRANKFLIVFLVLLALIAFAYVYFVKFNNKDNKSSKEEIKNNQTSSEYRISSNALENFDLYFLKLENEKKNKLYSPLSIKYALEMLGEATNGESKEQITNILGTYSNKQYINSENLSFANALFVKDSYKTAIKDTYTNTLTSKYNASVIYDSFNTPTTVNSWVSDKTFKLVDNLFTDVSSYDFILVNALAIDMEWVTIIQSETGSGYTEHYKHEKFDKYVGSLSSMGYHQLTFNDNFSAKSVEIGAVINKYDIVKTLGEDKIRKTVGAEYDKWLVSGDKCGNQEEPDTNTYLDQYIEELNSNYKDISSSTDFKFYVDDNVKMFAKDLKEYNGTTLQYIGIMPKSTSLDDYIKNTNSQNINTLINNLKGIELDSFKDGYVTEISGYIPMFDFDYELKLMDDLKQLGVTNVFDSSKADLTSLSSSNAYIGTAVHKANIEFSNVGIKAAAATAMGGLGAAGCGFDYRYDVPLEQIDLTFDKPYLFLIRDKNTGEVWFTGTVYEPVEYQPYLID